MADYLYIDRQHQLDLAATELARASHLAIDTESSGYFTYQPELCLVQLSGADRHYLIDPLAGLNLAVLAPLFENPAITKIFHAAQSDMVELRRAHPYVFRNLFDTMLASRMLGYEACSLGALVLRYCGVELEKREQKSNWKRRPLSRSQLDYAHLDTLYLAQLREKLQAEIDHWGLGEEFSEELERLTEVHANHEEKRPESDLWMRIGGALDLSPAERGVLRELVVLRERRARQENLAPFRIAANESILQLLRDPPRDLAALESRRGFHPSFLRKDGRRLLDAFRSAEPIGDDQLPEREKLDPVAFAAMRRLKRWRTRIAEFRGMDPSMIVSNRTLQTLSEERPADLQQLQAMCLLTPWKLKHYGDHLLRVIANKHEGRLPEGLPRVLRNEASTAVLGAAANE